MKQTKKLSELQKVEIINTAMHAGLPIKITGTKTNGKSFKNRYVYPHGFVFEHGNVLVKTNKGFRSFKINKIDKIYCKNVE